MAFGLILGGGLGHAIRRGWRRVNVRRVRCAARYEGPRGLPASLQSLVIEGADRFRRQGLSGGCPQHDGPADSSGSSVCDGHLGRHPHGRNQPHELQTAEELWTKYIQLTEAEAAFRALKSELAIRPLFHRLEHRVKAHILVAFLGYALWVTLKHLLQRGGTGLTPARALAQLATLQSADIILPTTDGREIRLRRVATSSPDQLRLLVNM